MGELALIRGRTDVATTQYAKAAQRLDAPDVARRATLIAVHAGDRDAAHRGADRWESLAPHDLEAAQYQAILHARAGDNATAMHHLLRIADDSVDGNGEIAGANLQMIATLLAAEPNPWRAADLMAGVAAARPQSAEGWYGAALLAINADRPARAVEFADNALARDPNLLDAMFLRARAGILAAPAGNGANALAPLAGFRNASDAGLRLRFAGLLVLAGREAEADALYEDILVGAPDQHDARMARALLALGDGRLDPAEAELHQLLQRHGRIQDALFYLGVLAEERGRPEDAIDWYARVAPDVERWLDAQYSIGRLLVRLDGAPAAQEFFTVLRAQWPEYATPLHVHEAAMLVATGHPELALQQLDAITPASDAERMEVDWQTALAAAESGDLERAESAYRGLLERDPGNPLLLNALGYLLLDQEARRQEAEALLETAREAAPANPAILDSLGWLRHRQGRSAEARTLLEESWQRQQAAVTGVHLLAVLLSIGDDAAAATLRDALGAQFPGVLDNEGSGS